MASLDDVEMQVGMKSSWRMVFDETSNRFESFLLALSNTFHGRSSSKAKAGSWWTTVPAAVKAREVAHAIAEDADHLVEPEALAAALNTSLEDGLPESEAQLRMEQDGSNILTPEVSTPLWRLFLRQLYADFGPILWAAAVLCVVAWALGDIRDPSNAVNMALAIVLIVVIFVQSLISFAVELKSANVLKQLTVRPAVVATVIRDGQEKELEAKDLVVGDLLVFNPGDTVPADARLIQVKNMRVDKSAITGQLEPILCTVMHTDGDLNQTQNIVFSGSTVISGSGKGLVVATGDETAFGNLARAAAKGQSQPSSLQKEISRFVLIIVFLAIFTGVAALIGWVSWLRVSYPNFLSLSNMIVNCIALIVAFVPVGMPVCVTATLTIIANDMVADKIMVRNLPVVEAMGSVSAILVPDNVGVLTQSMPVVSGTAPSEGAGEQAMLRAAVLCSTLRRISSGKMCGDVLEVSLFEYAVATADVHGLEDPQWLLSEWELLSAQPSDEKRQLETIHKGPEGVGHVLYLRGSLEPVLARCALGLKQAEAIKVAASVAASKGDIVLAFAQQVLDESIADFQTLPPSCSNGMTFLGWLALSAAPREGVAEAIAACRSASIHVAMVSGEQLGTAEAIARNVGLFQAGAEVDDFDSLNRENFRAEGRALVLTGQDLDHLDLTGWDRVSQYQDTLFTEVTTKQRLVLLTALQKRGHCVAAVGAGVNDAALLRQADCGIATNSGLAVSKEAANVVLLDDSLPTIVSGIQHGRRCFANLKKVIIYLLPAGSWSEMLPVVANVFLGMPMSLSAFLMIVICCFTDTPPSMALIYEKPEPGIMTQPPRKVGKDHLVTPQLLLHAYLFIGMMESTVAFGTFFWYYSLQGVPPSLVLLQFSNGDPELMAVGQTLFFYALVVMQLGNALTSRTATVPLWRQNPLMGAAKNPRLFGGMAVTCVVVAFTCYFPPLQNSALSTRALPGLWQPLLLPWFGALLLILVNELRKVWVESYPTSLLARLSWQ